jgi:type I restriction enzyme M protein
MPANTTDLEKRLWEAADNLRANSKLKSSEYSVPVLGLVFLSYAEYRFLRAGPKLENRSSRRAVTATDY